ncbi:MAG TPA: hypothetical protein VLC95_16505 [Anaerolineae bacterium]|nr:hypothetical protein [Anaerolineae bacterium]
MQTTHTQSEMQKMAARVERHHTAPMPDAQAPEPHPFPASVITTLWLGIVGGGVLGLFVGVLLQNNVLVLPSMEGLYSMAPFTFQFFWLIAGITLGIVGAAVATLLIPPPAYRADHAEHPEHVDVDSVETGNILEVDLDDDGK